MLSQAARNFPNAPRPFLDLSTGINPVPYPLAALPAEAATRLPDADDEARLRDVAAQAYNAADPAMVVAAPGTQILISLLPHLLRLPQPRVAILAPTYAEHAAAWRSVGAHVENVTDPADLAQADIAVVGNPNNPDGRRTDPRHLLALADRLAPRAGLLIVDEAFADLEGPGLSLVPHLPHPAILVLRSFGKTYGLAGLRLGFALAAPGLAARLRQALGPWAVAGPALAAGLQTLPDSSWRDAAALRLERDALRLDSLLADRAMTLVGGTRLFRLYEGEAAQTLHDRLGRAGILTRRFDEAPHRLRFGLPGCERDWVRLTKA